MCDPGFVGGNQRRPDLKSYIQRGRKFYSTLIQAFAQSLPIDEFRHQIMPLFAFADLMNSDDVRMIEGGGCAGLLLKASQPIRVRSEFGGQQLERDLAFQTSVFSQIDLTHSARPQRREDVVMA